MKHVQKIVFCIIIISVIGCFSSTENKKELLVDSTISYRVGNVYFNDLLNKSAEAKKPLLLYFTSFTSTSSRPLEDLILNDKKLLNSLLNDYIVVPLHPDDKEILPKEEWFYSKIMGIEVKTVGLKFSHWEMEKFETNALPYFVIVDEKGKKVKAITYTRDITELYDFFLRTE